MRRIMKLTPATIKRIIAEERKKLKLEEEAMILEGKEKLLKKLRLLKKIKNKQMNSLNEAKELHDLKKQLLNSIKDGK